MTTTSGFGGSGPVFVPALVPNDEAAAGDGRAEDQPVEDASPDEVAEEAAVVEHLNDPEVDAAIERLRADQD